MFGKLIEIMDKYQYREIRQIKDIEKPVFYIIRRKSPGAGFFSNYFYVLSHIIYAEKKGWLPVIDMENYKTLYSEDSEYMGTKNSWEYYFKQPVNISLEQAYQAENVVLSCNTYLGDQGVPVYTINQGHITDDMVKKIVSNAGKYIPVLPDIQKEAEDLFCNFFDGGYCIGVHIRGTDMKIAQDAHTMPPSTGRIIKEINKLMKKYIDAKIMLCCDEEQIIDFICNEFPDRVKVTDAFRSKGDSFKGIHMQSSGRKHHKYLLGKEVLMDSLMLSKCNSLICGISNVTSAAVLFNHLQYHSVSVLK